MKSYYAYIATNFNNTVLYTGVTNNAERRIYEHKNKLVSSFSSKYKIKKIVYVEEFRDINEAISAEKQIKGWTRQKKINLIKRLNPGFQDLLGSDPSLRNV